jgi:hypothetical protein
MEQALDPLKIRSRPGLKSAATALPGSTAPRMSGAIQKNDLPDLKPGFATPVS